MLSYTTIKTIKANLVGFLNLLNLTVQGKRVLIGDFEDSLHDVSGEK